MGSEANLALAIGMLACGPPIAWAASRWSGLTRLVDGFVMLSVGALVALHVLPEAIEEAHPEPAHKGPDTAVVVVMRKVLQIDNEVIAPIWIARVNHRVQHLHRVGVVDRHLPQELANAIRPLVAQHTIERCDHVAKDIASPTEAERRDLIDQVLLP